MSELGNATESGLFFEDRSGTNHEKMIQVRSQFLVKAVKSPALNMVRPNDMSDEPQFQTLTDDEKVQAFKLNMNDVGNIMSATWGLMYVNDFDDRGRVKKVYIQGEPGSRISPQDFDKWYIRDSDGDTVSFVSFATGKWICGSPKLERYSGISAVEILGESAPGYSSGDAVKVIENIAARLPEGFHIFWAGLPFEERLSGSQTPALHTLPLLIVFLCPTALYENWSIPLSVMPVVLLGVLEAVCATLLRGLGNDVFFQVGLLTIIGSSTRNVILIVELARKLYEKEGLSIREVAAETARVRLRPIIMASLAFIMGVIPLAVPTGVSSGSKHTIGTDVVGGMITVMILAISYIPLFYMLIVGFFSRRNKKSSDKTEAEQS